MRKYGFFALLLALPLSAQDLATTVKSTEVVPGIYMLEGVDGFSSNIGLMVGDEHVLLIDNGMAPITASLIESPARNVAVPAASPKVRLKIVIEPSAQPPSPPAPLPQSVRPPPTNAASEPITSSTKLKRITDPSKSTNTSIPMESFAT